MRNYTYDTVDSELKSYFWYLWFIYSLTKLNLIGCIAISNEGVNFHCTVRCPPLVERSQNSRLHCCSYNKVLIVLKICQQVSPSYLLCWMFSDLKHYGGNKSATASSDMLRPNLALAFSRENPHEAYLLVLSQDWITAAFLWTGRETNLSLSQIKSHRVYSAALSPPACLGFNQTQ